MLLTYFRWWRIALSSQKTTSLLTLVFTKTNNLIN